MPDPTVVVAMRQFKAGLLAREMVQMQEMARHWLGVERALEANLLGLAEEVDAMRAAGQTVNPGKLYRMKRYERLLVQSQAEFTEYARYVDGRIAQAQREMLTMGIDHSARATQLAMYPRVGVDFDVLPISAVEHMVGMAGDGKPLGDLLRSRMVRDADGNPLPDVWPRLTKTLVDGTALGWGPRKTARLMRNDLAGGLNKALVISRSETMRVYRQASVDQYNASGVVTAQKRLVAHDGRTCPACLADDGAIYPIDAIIPDHPQGRCVVPGSLVSGPPVTAFISRDYDGDVITISTASGKLMTVTPNHPILTDSGWVAAHLIHEGDNVVSYGGNEWATAAVCPDEYQVPTLIEDIPRALNMDVLASMPATAEDFHGDGGYSQVYVVSVNRLLRDNLDASFLQPGLQHLFSRRDTRAPFLSRLGNVASMLERLVASSGRFLGDCYAAVMFLHRCLLGQELVGLCLASEGNTSNFQPLVYGGPGNTKVFGEAIHRLATQVASSEFINGNRQLGPGGTRRLFARDGATLFERSEQPASLEFIREALFTSVIPGSTGLGAITSDVILDCVLEIGSRTFRGHVHNLQTQDGWYSVNGIITHNCTGVPIVEGMPEPAWETGEDWFNAQPEDTQRSIMGKGRYEAWKAGDVQFQDFVTHTDDPTWGAGLAVTPLKDLVR